jgi:hypothetical protein
MNCVVESDLRSHERQQEQEIAKDRAKDDFYETHSWTEILSMGDIDTDDVLANLWEGNQTVAKQIMKKALDRAFEKYTESQY